jgi:hypothetical protein
LSNKLSELQALLDSWLIKPAVLCVSEHWHQYDQLIHINIDQYKLADKFCRNSDKRWGYCIFVLKELKISELLSLTNIGREKVFEISAIELVDFKTIVVCTYRFPKSNAKNFLELLEITVNKLAKRGRFFIL